MRILVLTSVIDGEPGGAELYAIDLATSLAGRGHDVHFAVTACAEGTRDILKGAGVHLHEISALYPYRKGGKAPAWLKATWHLMDVYNPSTAWNFRKLAKRIQPEVTHVHIWQGLSGAVLQAPSGGRVFHTVHDMALLDTRTTLTRGGRPVKQPSWPQRLRTRLLMAMSREVFFIFPSQRFQDVHARAHNALARRSIQLPHGWQMPPASSISSLDESEGGKFRFVFVGRLASNKGLDILLEAWPVDGFLDAELIIAGHGPLAPVVEDVAQRKSGIRYIGSVTGAQKSDLFSSAHVICVPSTWPENFPLVVAEAWLAGIPVASTRIASPPLLEHGVSGWLLPSTAQSWEKFFSETRSETLDYEIVKRGASENAVHLDWESHISKIEAIYGD